MRLFLNDVGRLWYEIEEMIGVYAWKNAYIKVFKITYSKGH